jgi:GAF domain-containing protein
VSTSTLRFLQQENARLKEENTSLREENLALRGYMSALEELQLATQQIISEENLFDLLDRILYSAMNVLQAEGGSLLLLDEETAGLVFVLVHSDIQQQLRGYRIPPKQGIAGSVADSGQPLIVNNPHQDRRFYQQIDTEFGFSTRSIVCVPMISRDRLVGVIELLNKSDGEEFIQADVSLLSILAQVAATALVEMQARLEAEEAEAKDT